MKEDAGWPLDDEDPEVAAWGRMVAQHAGRLHEQYPGVGIVVTGPNRLELTFDWDARQQARDLLADATDVRPGSRTMRTGRVGDWVYEVWLRPHLDLVIDAAIADAHHHVVGGKVPPPSSRGSRILVAVLDGEFGMPVTMPAGISDEAVDVLRTLLLDEVRRGAGMSTTGGSVPHTLSWREALDGLSVSAALLEEYLHVNPRLVEAAERVSRLDGPQRPRVAD